MVKMLLSSSFMSMLDMLLPYSRTDLFSANVRFSSRSLVLAPDVWGWILLEELLVIFAAGSRPEVASRSSPSCFLSVIFSCSWSSISFRWKPWERAHNGPLNHNFVSFTWPGKDLTGLFPSHVNHLNNWPMMLSTRAFQTNTLHLTHRSA